MAELVADEQSLAAVAASLEQIREAARRQSAVPTGRGGPELGGQPPRGGADRRRAGPGGDARRGAGPGADRRGREDRARRDRGGRVGRGGQRPDRGRSGVEAAGLTPRGAAEADGRPVAAQSRCWATSGAAEHVPLAEPDPVEVGHDRAVGPPERRSACSGRRRFVAVRLDDRLGPAQVRARHRREQVVLDLVVQAAQGDVDRRRPPVTLRLVSTCRRRKSILTSAGTIGMPLWFGAKEAPM